MIHLDADFSAGRPITSVPASWFNAVANFINNLVPGKGIRFDKNADGASTIVEVDIGDLTEEQSLSELKADGTGSGGAASFGTSQKVPRTDHSHPLNVADSGAPADTVLATGAASNGTSAKYARQDHVHKMPALVAANVAVADTNVEAVLENHEDRLEVLEDGGGGSGTVTSVDGHGPDANGNVSLANDTTLVQRSMIGQANGVQEHSEVLDAVADGGHYDTTDGAHDITSGAHYIAATSQKARLLGIAAGASDISARDAIGADMVTYDGENALDDIIPSTGVIDGESHIKVGAVSGRFVKTTTSGKLTTTTDKVATFATAPAGSKFVKTSGSNGGLVEVTESLATFATAPATGKIVITDGTQGGLATVSPYATSPFTVDVVTSVAWNGTQINITGKTLTFTNGVLTGVANKSFSPITTVTYNP